MARSLSNRIKLNSRLGFELTGYIGSKSSNTFQRIDSSEITASSTSEGWLITIKAVTSKEFKLDIHVTKLENHATFMMQPLNAKIPNLDDLFLTLLIRDYRTNAFYCVYHGHIKSFKTRYIELPAQVTMGLDDFASSIADSIKDAHKNISQRMGDNSFDLEIGDFEIKVPYITQVGSNNKLVMKMPQSIGEANSGEPAFSKISFKRIMKLE